MTDCNKGHMSTLILPRHLRDALKDPLGPVVQTDELIQTLRGKSPILSVGDIVTRTLNSLGITPLLAIVDGSTRRGPVDHPVDPLRHGEKVIKVNNPAGVITPGLWLAISEAVMGEIPVVIVVDGEEDLATLPCVLEAPDGAAVLYGDPGKGVVVTLVTDDVRRRVRAITENMDRG